MRLQRADWKLNMRRTRPSMMMTRRNMSSNMAKFKERKRKLRKVNELFDCLCLLTFSNKLKYKSLVANYDIK